MAIKHTEKKSEHLSDSKENEDDDDIFDASDEEIAVAALTSIASASPSNESEEEEEDEMVQNQEKNAKNFVVPELFTKSGHKRAVPFALKLMKVLSNEEYAEIITWMPSGKSFYILKPKAFVSTILSKHFKTAKYSSFTRKLYRWGFVRQYRGEEAGAYFHKNFQKDRMDLVEKMRCRKDEPAKPFCVPSPRQQAVSKQRPNIPQQPMTQNTNLQQIPSSTASSNIPYLYVPQPMALSDASAFEINAAIEIEVARRLQEQLDAASIHRQALMMIQHQLSLHNDTITPLRDPRVFELAQAQQQQISQSQKLK